MNLERTRWRTDRVCTRLNFEVRRRRAAAIIASRDEQHGCKSHTDHEATDCKAEQSNWTIDHAGARGDIQGVRWGYS